MYCLQQDELLPVVQLKNLTLSFSSESSIEEELKRESTADAITILVSSDVFIPYMFVHMHASLPFLPTMLITILSLV